jgi:fumarylpyruvate hydrolase
MARSAWRMTKGQEMTFTVSATFAAVKGGGEFPVRRIYCVGRNYRAHAIEMGKDPDREFPFFFMKPADALVPAGSTIAYPPRTTNFHYEAELVVALGGGGHDIAVADAESLIFGYAAGLDMTRRDVQLEARDKGRPWDMGKGFDQSAPIGLIHPIAETGPMRSGKIELAVNNVVKQSSDISLLIWNVAETIADLSTYVELAPGDLIYTGTPEGVGPVVPGDRMVVRIDGLSALEIMVGD